MCWRGRDLQTSPRAKKLVGATSFPQHHPSSLVDPPIQPTLISRSPFQNGSCCIISYKQPMQDWHLSKETPALSRRENNHTHQYHYSPRRQTGARNMVWLQAAPTNKSLSVDNTGRPLCSLVQPEPQQMGRRQVSGLTHKGDTDQLPARGRPRLAPWQHRDQTLPTRGKVGH